MPVTLAFDVYGTLIDTRGVVSKLKDIVGETAEEFSQAWRSKQLEYSFRRGLMRRYENFAVCTRDALNYACNIFRVPLTDSQRAGLLDAYRFLPAFEDVKDSLIDLQTAGFRLCAFSNGAADSVTELLEAAGVRGYFRAIISVDDVKSFKPSPDVYAHFLKMTDAAAADSWLISSNPFDVLGALSAGMNSAWVKRSQDAVFDPWGIAPTLIVGSLRELRASLTAN
jgi:2-haloacid dehalogenase